MFSIWRSVSVTGSAWAIAAPSTQAAIESGQILIPIIGVSPDLVG
jgi:hypothetical protein